MISLRSAADDYSTAASFGASWLLHGLLVAAACLIYFHTDSGIGDDPELVATISDDLEQSAFERLSTEVEMSLDSSGGSAPDAVRFDVSVETPDPPNLDVRSTERMASAFDDLSDVNWASEVSEFEGMRFGAGSGDSVGDGSGNNKFFGLGAEGETFVFVVDSSGSMRHPYPAPARNRFNRVKMELVRTIGDMTPDQKFFIIFFNSGTLPMPANRLMPADSITQQQYLSWMAQVPVGGDTEPEEALLLALYLQPDVIYFLTDGAFAYRVTENVRRANTLGVPIHTIGFGDNEGEEWLLKIAEESGGNYQFITQENDAMLNPSDEE